MSAKGLMPLAPVATPSHPGTTRKGDSTRLDIAVVRVKEVVDGDGGRGDGREDMAVRGVGGRVIILSRRRPRIGIACAFEACSVSRGALMPARARAHVRKGRGGGTCVLVPTLHEPPAWVRMATGAQAGCVQAFNFMLLLGAAKLKV
jgi:hypothetical protein